MFYLELLSSLQQIRNHGIGAVTTNSHSVTVCGFLNLIMMLPLVYLILDALNAAANAVTASSVGAGRLILAAQQLQDCLEKNNPYQNNWLPGMVAQNTQWLPNPCQGEQEQVEALQNQAAAGGNQVASMQLGAAPAPQLAEATDPVPSTNPAIPANEWDVPEHGANNQWSPIEPEEIIEMIIQELGDQPRDEEMIQDILEGMKYVQLWCPWGGPKTRNLKWKFQYRPNNSDWIGKWCP